MKKVILLVILAIVVSCNNDRTTSKNKSEAATVYPENISNIFEAHGGIEAWRALESMYFEIEKPEGNDKYDISLKDRKSLITTKHHKLGFDGNDIWLQHLDTVSYKGNPKFYYNLMFYFYAMPFVLGDEGINYKETQPLEYEGVSYPGILISYNADVGESPEDEYILYYHPETYKMSWLAYTVTFFSKEKSKKFNLIKYQNWEDVSGVNLPSSIQWHHYNEGLVGEVRNEVNFVKAKLSKEMANKAMFKAPDSTLIIK